MQVRRQRATVHAHQGKRAPLTSLVQRARESFLPGPRLSEQQHRGLGRDRQCDRIVEALTGLAHGLGVDIVAEGVETTQQRDVLTGFGCAHAQGSRRRLSTW